MCPHACTRILHVDFHAADCVFRAGCKWENCNVYSKSEAQDSPPPYQQGVMEHLSNSAGDPVAKMNGNVARLSARRSWEDDADSA